MPQVWIDGVAQPSGTAPLALDDPSFSRPLVFETLRTWDRRPFRVGAHLARLATGARWLGVDWDEAASAAELAVAAAGEREECRLYVILDARGRRIVQSATLEITRVGAPIRVVSGQADSSAPPWVKHGDRAGAERRAREAGVDEVLWSRGGRWTETNRSNLFVVRGGVLLTPPADGTILPGVTRAAVLEAARALGIPTHEEPVEPGPADELWASSTLKELAPIVAIDGVPAPGAGPVGTRLLREFRRRARLPP